MPKKFNQLILIRKISFFILVALSSIVLSACSSDSKESQLINAWTKSQLTDINEKKISFVQFIVPKIREQNYRVLQTRKKIIALSSRALTSADLPWLKAIGNRYEYPLESQHPSSEWLSALLNRVDMLPVSLILAQAINESAWGTSRFAKQGNNYFGIWCYTPGCGIVPLQRSPHLSHEVQRFKSAQENLAQYLTILNSRTAYASLRTVRAKMRAQKKPFDSIIMADELNNYSEKGKIYSRIIKNIIEKYQLKILD